ncbi:diguanylate cyclase domain-containing protein [Pontibacterium sp.]
MGYVRKRLLQCVMPLIVLLSTFFVSGGVYSESLFDTSFRTQTAIMLLISPEDGRIVEANEAAARFYGYSVDQLKTMKVQEINQLSKQAVAEEMVLAKEENRNYFIFKHRLANGEVRTVNVASVPITYHGETVLYSIIADATDLSNASEALLHYQERLESLVAQKTQQLFDQKERQKNEMLSIIVLLVVLVGVLLAVLMINRRSQHTIEVEKERLNEVIWGTRVGTWEWHIPSGKVTFNERWAEIAGYTLEELEPISIETWVSLCNEEDLEKSNELLQKNFSGELGYYECEARMKHKAGHWIWVLDRGKVVEWDKHGNPVRMSGTHQDITEQKKLYSKLDYMAHYDALTGLSNRALFYEKGIQAMLNAKRHRQGIAVLYIDLDGFKQVNDSCGHEAGDKVLVDAAARMKNLLRESDILCRLGGDEFAAIIQDVGTQKDGMKVAENIRAVLSKPYDVECSSANVSASIGVAFYPEDSTDLDELMRQADDAMYMSKQSGKNTVSKGQHVLEES